MDYQQVSTQESHADQWLPVLLLLFVGSGAAALIYEIVWFQMLELYVGSSAVSVGVLLELLEDTWAARGRATRKSGRMECSFNGGLYRMDVSGESMEADASVQTITQP